MGILNPLELWSKFKCKPIAKENQRQLVQAERMLQSMDSEISEQAISVTEALQQLGCLEWETVNKIKEFLDEICASDCPLHQLFKGDNLHALTAAIQGAVRGYEKISPSMDQRMLAIITAFGFSPVLEKTAAAAENDHDISDPTKLLLSCLDIKLSEDGEIPLVGMGCLSLETDCFRPTWMGIRSTVLWTAILPATPGILPFESPAMAPFKELDEQWKKLNRLYAEIKEAQVKRQKIEVLRSSALNHREDLRNMVVQFDAAVKLLAVSKSQEDALRAITIAEILYGLCGKALLVKSTSGRIDIRYQAAEIEDNEKQEV